MTQTLKGLARQSREDFVQSAFSFDILHLTSIYLNVYNNHLQFALLLYNNGHIMKTSKALYQTIKRTS